MSATGSSLCEPLTHACTTSVSGMLLMRPSLTTSCARYNPGRSTGNVGADVCESLNSAMLPGGTDVRDQTNSSRSSSASNDLVPLNVTTAPAAVIRSLPASATGRILWVPTTTVSGALRSSPSLTVNCKMYRHG